MLLYLVPKAVSLNVFLHYIALLSALLGSLGLLPLLVGEFKIVVLPVELHTGHNIRILGTNVEVLRIQSVFGNPNGLARLVGPGSLVSAYLLLKTRKWRYLLFFSLSAICLYLTGSRSGSLIFFSGVLIYASLFIMNKLNIGSLSRVIVDCVFTTISLVIAIALLGRIELLYLLPVDFTNRLLLWEATANLIRDNTIAGMGYNLGYDFMSPLLPERFEGYSPHNSYLRMFLHTGIVGGISYILFHYIILSRFSRTNMSNEDQFLLSLTITMIIIQLFETFSTIGLTHGSVISSICLGYCLYRTAN
ncbi:O-antigen ligase family protein [Halorubrum sp. JWXQ-INN 858]|uniref:O-antigen ligase family protein n=1 Tax=Halorubrum sp. JWXQ-INN 858 TaxID=2690782 RepID=UPI0037424E37